MLDSYATGTDTNKPPQSWEEWKKNQQESVGENDSQFSEQWKKAHKAIQNSNTTPKPLEPQIVGQPSDVISTLTLPIWFREKRSPLYKPDDQEFKDFAKLQADEKKTRDLKVSVARTAAQRLSQPSHQNALKHIGWDHGEVHVFVELVPQLLPPPLYQVPAIIFFKDGVSLGWKTLRPDLGTKMEAVFRPSATWVAAKASLKAFFVSSYTIAKAKLSGRDPPGMHGTGFWKRTLADKLTKDPSSGNVNPPNVQWSMDQQSVQELVRSIHNNHDTRERHDGLLKNVPLSAAIEVAAHVFRHRQLVEIAHKQTHMARGAVQIKGVLACKGKVGMYKVNFMAVYLPSEDRFVGPVTLHQPYIVKDYKKVQQMEDQNKKALRDSQVAKQEKVEVQAQLALLKPKQDDEEQSVDSTKPKSESEDQSNGIAKPPTGKENE